MCLSVLYRVYIYIYIYCNLGYPQSNHLPSGQITFLDYS